MGEVMEHLGNKTIMNQAAEAEGATTIPSGSTLEAIASGSAHNLDKRLRYSLNCKVTCSSGNGHAERLASVSEQIVIPQHLEQVITNSLPRLSPTLAMITPKFDFQMV